MITVGDVPLVPMRAVATYSGTEGFVRRGEVIHVPAARAQVLQRRGLAVPMVTQTAAVKPKPGPSAVQATGPTQVQAVVPEETKAEDEGTREDGGILTAWVCSIDGCGREFASRRGLVMHQRQAHPEVTVEEGGLYREG